MSLPSPIPAGTGTRDGNALKALAADWSEYDYRTAGKPTLPLLDMHAGDLAALRYEHRAHLREAMVRCVFLRTIAEGLEHSTQTVGEAFTPQQLEAMHRRATHAVHNQER